MKTLIISNFRRFVLATLLAVPFAVQAESSLLNPEKPQSFQMGMYRIANSSKINLTLIRSSESPLSLRLVDENGKVLYRETLGQNQMQYKRNFDLGQVENGIYYFELTSGKETFRKRVELSTPTQPLIEIQ